MSNTVSNTDHPRVRAARQGDLQSLLNMARRFVSETSLPLTFDAEIATRTLLQVIQSDGGILLVEEDDGVLTGLIVGVVERDFCVERCAYVTKMYVERELRGLGTARALVKAFQVEAEQLGASVIFAAATAGMGQDVERLFVKLFERNGYVVLGRVLVKEIHNG